MQWSMTREKTKCFTGALDLTHVIIFKYFFPHHIFTFLPYLFFPLLLLAAISHQYANTLWYFSSLKKSFCTMSPSILPSIFPFLCSLFFLSHLYYILYQNFIKSSYKFSLFHHYLPYFFIYS